MRPPRLLLPLAVGLLALVGCETTAAPDGGSSSPAAAPAALGSEPPDPHAAVLTSALEDLRASVGAAREALVAAGTADGAAGEDAAELAVALLAAEDELDGATSGPDPRPLFPGPESSRARTIDYGDAFSETLSAARAAGQAGAPVLDLLRDPVAGDLGNWQRDAGGTLDHIRDTARGADDLADAEAAIAELDGEGPKALAWSLLAADAASDEARAAFAERGVAHLDVIVAAIDEALTDRRPTDAGDDG